MKVSQAVELYNNFGFDVAFSSVCASRFKSASDYRNRNILNYLKEEYKDFISEYQRKDYDANAKNKNSKRLPIKLKVERYLLLKSLISHIRFH